ncbi:MAG: DUF975 family protein [Bacteroidales bacterium]|nr:DUF975 family protein [Bacteroidales bacterium]MCF8334471.1 DUF975 family protein [Bacteroidales bacterium]
MNQPYDVFNEITAVGTYSKAWEILKRFFPDLLFIVILMVIFQLPTAATNEDNVGYGIFTFFYWLLIMGPVNYGLAYGSLQVVRKNRFKIEPAFNAVKNNYPNIILANLLQSIIIGIGIVLLLVPGIIFAIRLAFVPYLVTEKSMEATEAIKTSWQMTSPYAWRIFFMGLLAIPIFIAGLILLGVGVIVSLMWIGAAFAMLYHWVDRENTGEVLQ